LFTTSTKIHRDEPIIVTRRQPLSTTTYTDTHRSFIQHIQHIKYIVLQHQRPNSSQKIHNLRGDCQIERSGSLLFPMRYHAPMNFDEIVTKLAEREPLPPLAPTQPFDAALSRTIRNANLPALVTCGLLIWNDDIPAAHPIAQDIEDASGSYWHAIVHRREGDYSNAKYWFRRTGQHPVLAELAGVSEANPFARTGVLDGAAFVDACERAARDKRDEALRALQVAEIRALLRYCRVI
jgi:hypothetical protein